MLVRAHVCSQRKERVVAIIVDPNASLPYPARPFVRALWMDAPPHLCTWMYAMLRGIRMCLRLCSCSQRSRSFSGNARVGEYFVHHQESESNAGATIILDTIAAIYSRPLFLLDLAFQIHNLIDGFAFGWKRLFGVVGLAGQLEERVLQRLMCKDRDDGPVLSRAREHVKTAVVVHQKSKRLHEMRSDASYPRYRAFWTAVCLRYCAVHRRPQRLPDR